MPFAHYVSGVQFVSTFLLPIRSITVFLPRLGVYWRDAFYPIAVRPFSTILYLTVHEKGVITLHLQTTRFFYIFCRCTFLFHLARGMRRHQCHSNCPREITANAMCNDSLLYSHFECFTHYYRFYSILLIALCPI